MTINISPEVLQYLEADLLLSAGVGYSTGYNSYQDNTNTIAKAVMLELVKAGKEDFLLLRNESVAKWWSAVLRGIQAKIDKKKETQRVYDLKLSAYEKLLPAERTLLKIRKPVAPK